MMRGHRRDRRRGLVARDQEALRARDRHRASRASTGAPVGIVANQPKWKGGVLFVDSADKAARFIWLCDAFNVPLLYLADVPGFMIGTKVERQGIIRAGAKMIAAVSARRPCRRSRVVVRKAYGAGLYAMCGPGVRARRVHRAAAGVDRRDGPAGRGQRGLLQQDPGDARRARARRATSRSCATSTGRTSTSSSSPASWWSTPWCRRSAARRDPRALRALRGRASRAQKKHMVPPV